MKTDLKVLAMIGARSGSKGVPHKNIKILAGKPLMGWIIEAAKSSRYVNRVIVSTDSSEYQKIANSFGAETPFLRPPEISTDQSVDYEFITDALANLKEKEGYVPDIVLRLLATCPLQQADDIDCCIEELLKDKEADSAVVIAEARQHPAKALKLIPDGNGGNYLVSYSGGSGREVTPLGRQRYEKAYFRANVVASRIKTICEMNSLTGDKVRYHIIPQERAVDIDTLVDFYIVEALMKKFK